MNEWNSVNKKSGGRSMSMKIPFIKKKKEEYINESENVPNHVAIIMDGNGRWARQRGLPRIAGHKEGVHAINRVVRAASKANIKVLTIYAFSTENWKRPKSEVEFLMKLPKEFLNVYLPDIMKNNVKIQTIGELDALPSHTKEVIQYAIDKTSENDGLLLNIALNYGSRFEIIRAIKQMIDDVNDSKITTENINEGMFSNYLYTKDLVDPDLLIRTSGEQRLSNFLLWQSAYTELWFTDVHWPDFNENIFNQALNEFKQRKRRYGGL